MSAQIQYFCDICREPLKTYEVRLGEDVPKCRVRSVADVPGHYCDSCMLAIESNRIVKAGKEEARAIIAKIREAAGL